MQMSSGWQTEETTFSVLVTLSLEQNTPIQQNVSFQSASLTEPYMPTGSCKILVASNISAESPLCQLDVSA